MELLKCPTAEQIDDIVNQITWNCCRCILHAQPDFIGQKSGIEEVYEAFNHEHHTEYKCIFLPKFHPELNPIERCWNIMKRFVRKNNDGTITTLRKNMEKGLSPEILPISLIRKYFRLT